MARMSAVPAILSAGARGTLKWMLLAPLCAAMGTPQPRALQGTAGRGHARGAADRTRAVGTEVAAARTTGVHMPGSFEVSRGKNGKVNFDLLASNRRVILTSEAYKQKRSALNGIASVKK